MSHRVTYREALLSTEYCLVATGNGFGVRLIDYMASGCIPVILSSGVWYPFEGMPSSARDASRLRYHTFAHVFPLEEAHKVVEVLQAQSDDQRARRRAAMREQHRKFLWDEDHGEAYEQTMKALAQVAAEMG